MNQMKLTLQAAKTGFCDAASLRQLLIATTSTETYEIAMSYFRAHLDDKELLDALIPIALEGEDAGDAPWAAANVIAEFSATLLKTHEASLKQLSNEQWVYLNGPANKALAKIAASPDA